VVLTLDGRREHRLAGPVASTPVAHLREEVIMAWELTEVARCSSATPSCRDSHSSPILTMAGAITSDWTASGARPLASASSTTASALVPSQRRRTSSKRQANVRIVNAVNAEVWRTDERAIVMMPDRIRCTIARGGATGWDLRLKAALVTVDGAPEAGS
jgi:hypothetical protein